MFYICYGCYPSLFSKIIANLLVIKKMPVNKIIVSRRNISIENHEISGGKGVLFLFKRFTIRYVLFQTVVELILSIGLKIYFKKKGLHLFSLKELCKHYHIQYIESNDFNRDVNTIGQIDVFVSMCLDQILREDFIKKTKKLCINIHPSEIPNFGGVEPIIQQVITNQKKMGISVHKITPNIDNGEVINRTYVEIKQYSYYKLMCLFIINGIKLIEELYHNNWTYKSKQQIALTYPYRSWPTKMELHDYEAKQNYIEWNELINYKIWNNIIDK